MTESFIPPDGWRSGMRLTTPVEEPVKVEPVVEVREWQSGMVPVVDEVPTDKEVEDAIDALAEAPPIEVPVVEPEITVERITASVGGEEVPVEVPTEKVAEEPVPVEKPKPVAKKKAAKKTAAKK